MSEPMRTTFKRVSRAPWREILHYRWSAEQERALVLQDAEGDYHLLWPGRRYQERSHRAGFDGHTSLGDSNLQTRQLPPSPRLGADYEGAFHVDVTEQQGIRAIRLPQQYGPPEPVTISVLWWVHDPVQVVSTQTTNGWNAVRGDLDQRLRHLEKTYAAESRRLDAAETWRNLSAPAKLDHIGITYEVTDVSSREADDELLLSEPDAGGVPYTWTNTRREEYDFCLQAVRSGPVSLAALWLLREPDQVRDVLDWSVNHRKLIQEEASWQDQMVGLLGSLSQEERQELSELLRDRLLTLGRKVPTGERAERWSP
jgi:hypothetical protein